MFELRDYQQKNVDDVLKALEDNDSVLSVLPTGAGKSVVISNLVSKLAGRTLILTHRAEILIQNADKLNNNELGILTAKHSYNLKAKYVIAMVETAFRRLSKNINYMGGFDNIVIDEAHIQVFKKVYELILVEKRIGFTATPTLLKREIFKDEDDDDVNYIKNYTMGDFYDVLVQGPQVSELIKLGYLTKEKAYALKMPNFNRLSESVNEYTTKMLDSVYNNKASYDLLMKIYDDYCVGRKVLIFNATTNVNREVHKILKSKGVDTKSYDSVNNSEGDRGAIVEWFSKLTGGGVLIGTNVFTTGFDVSDIDVVIINRATKSFALWIQMVGRGSRIAEGKDHFTVVDLGQNIEAFGLWSRDINWEEHFKIKERYKSRKIDILNIWECKLCGAYNVEGDKNCIICEAEKHKKVIEYSDKNGIIVEVHAAIPTAKNIIEYAKRNNEDASFAFKLLENRILDLFVDRKITKERFDIDKVKLLNRVEQIYRPIYFAIIKSGLKGKNRRLSTQMDRVLKKVNKIYE